MNWKKHTTYGIEATGEEGRSADLNYTDNLLVYPTLSPKDGQEAEPYKTITENFRTFMESADVCIVIGFSFRDEHINSISSDFLKRGRRIIIVVSPSADQNIYANLLKRSPRVAQKAPWSRGRTIKLYKESGTAIITINQALFGENVHKIKQMIDDALKELLKGKTSDK